jgi:hypothetical protein
MKQKNTVNLAKQEKTKRSEKIEERKKSFLVFS